MSGKDPVYSKSPHFVFRKVAGESILVPLRKQLNEVNSLYVLNETAAAIWERLDGRARFGSILEDLGRDLEVEFPQFEKDASALVEDLLNIQAIENCRT